MPICSFLGIAGWSEEVRVKSYSNPIRWQLIDSYWMSCYVWALVHMGGEQQSKRRYRMLRGICQDHIQFLWRQPCNPKQEWEKRRVLLRDLNTLAPNSCLPSPVAGHRLLALSSLEYNCFLKTHFLSWLMLVWMDICYFWGKPDIFINKGKWISIKLK